MEKALCILVSLSWILPTVLCEDCTAANINRTNIALDVYTRPENKNDTCEQIPILSSDRYLFSGSLWTLDEGKNLIQYFVTEGKNDTVIFFKIIKEEKLCGQRIWITNQPEYIVVSSNDTSSGATTEFRYENKIHLYEDMVQACQIEKLQNRTIIDLIRECPLALYLTILVLVYVLWKIVIALFDVIINCCTLIKVERSKACCCTYIFSALCSSLTNRHISLNQQRDIDSLKIDFRGGRSKDEEKSVKSEFVYLNYDMYDY